MTYSLREEAGFKYIDEGEGDILLLLHGLFGALSNWQDVIQAFAPTHRVIIPIMPIYEMPIKSASVEGLVHYIEDFVKMKKISDLTLLGNSLGGHVGIIYTLKNKSKVKRLALTGSSGLFENSMGGSYPKRGNYEYIKERIAYTFYDPKNTTKELVDEVFGTITSIPKCMRIIAIAKSAQRNNLADDLHKITVPTLLIWGLNDTITPPLVAYEFNRLIPNSKLRFIDCCGHAPMMEHPEKFNKIFKNFIESECLQKSS